jgi:hypothetical protein
LASLETPENEKASKSSELLFVKKQFYYFFFSPRIPNFNQKKHILDKNKYDACPKGRPRTEKCAKKTLILSQ